MEGATLEAQVEIAWGESQVVLSQFLGAFSSSCVPAGRAGTQDEAEALPRASRVNLSTCGRPLMSTVAWSSRLS